MTSTWTTAERTTTTTLNDGDFLGISKEFGIIVNGGDGIESAINAHVSIEVEGEVAGSNDGIQLSGGSNTIVVGSGGLVAGGNIGMVLPLGGNSLVNNGQISGPQTGLELSGDFNSIANAGSISGHTIGVDLGAGDGAFLNNSGLILATGTAIQSGSVQGDSASVTNTGTIQGAIAFSGDDENDSITNGGTIIGDVFLGAGNDTYDSSHGVTTGRIGGGEGNDTLIGGPGNDLLEGDSGADKLDGGAGIDTADYHSAQGDIVINLLLGTGRGDEAQGDTLKNIENVTGGVGSDTLIGSNGANVLAGGQGDDSVVAANDTLIGNGGDDTLIIASPGNATLQGGGGNDTLEFTGKTFSTGDRVDGGAGADTLTLDGNYSAGVKFAAATVRNVETILLADGHAYKLTTADATVASGKTLAIDGTGITGSTDNMTVNGSAETDGHLDLLGGAGADALTGGRQADTISGGAGSDTIRGGGGGDFLNGGPGSDNFVYGGASDSTGAKFDTLTRFDAQSDKIDLPFAVTGVNAKLSAGHLSLATFNADLSAALTAAHLSANHAVLFQPNGGDLKGDLFLVIDANGVAGYQANKDIVIALSQAVHIGSLSTADFVVH